MRITAIEEYGLRCMIQLARVGVGERLSIAEIAHLEGISVPYASKLLAILRRSGLVVAERGRGGGFSISRVPSSITMFDTVTALGGPLIDPNHCQKFSGLLDTCVHSENCTMYEVLGGLAGYLQEFLSSTTLEELISRDRINLLTRQAVMDGSGEVSRA